MELVDSTDFARKGQVWLANQDAYLNCRPAHIILSEPELIDFHPFLKKKIPLGWYVIAYQIDQQDVWLAVADRDSWTTFGACL